jgi:hypothetical protein
MVITTDNYLRYHTYPFVDRTRTPETPGHCWMSRDDRLSRWGTDPGGNPAWHVRCAVDVEI